MNLDELEHLRSWRDQAIPFLRLLDECHDLLPSGAQAKLGHSKADAVLAWVKATASAA